MAGIKESGTSNQSLYRGLKLIELLADYPNGCALNTLSEAAKLNKSTVYRLVQELQSCGFVRPCTNGSYRLSSKLLEIGYRVMSDSNIYNLISEPLNKLNLELGETVNFSKREGDHCILLYKLNPISSVSRTRTGIGQTMPLYCTGMGKCYLAFDSDEKIEDYWKSHQQQIRLLTEYTVINFFDFMNQVRDIRKTLLSYDHEENELGISCIAAPIFNINYENEYALSVSATTKKLDYIGREKIEALITETASRISAELGCADYLKASKLFEN